MRALKLKIKRLATIIAVLLCGQLSAQKVNFEYLDSTLPIEQRVELLMSQMTLDEKISQVGHTSAAVERLNIPEYNWWNECLHGVARAGYATVFPQSITIAASFDKELVYQVGSVISDEARAKHHKFIKEGQRGIYQGLDFWSPNINIFRDPRWGRGHETYGEDPFLTGILGTAFIQGVQGEDQEKWKLVATAKHFAVHSGPEPLRHSFDVDVSDVDLYETYLPAFRMAVKDGNVHSIMGAYNRFRGASCSADQFLLEELLRDQWGFNGYVVSDCGAIDDIHSHHKITSTAAESAALGIKNGCDLNCGSIYTTHLEEAFEKDLLTEADLDIALARLLTARFRLGMFDAETDNPYASIPYSVVSSSQHISKAREAAQKSMVLLKNSNNTLPLDKSKIRKIAVVGPNADNFEALLGNYNGIPKDPVTPFQGITNMVSPKIEVNYALGSELANGIYDLYPIPSVYLETEDGKQGVVGEYFTNKTFEGEPLFTRVDDKIDVYYEQSTPGLEMKDDNYSIRWTGYIVPPVSGEYRIGTWSMPKFTLEFEGEEILSGNNDHHAFHADKGVTLEAGKKYKFVYEYVNFSGDGDAKLLWSVPQENKIAEAVKLANSSDVTIAVVGLSQRLEGEEMPIKIDGFDRGDRTAIDLPKAQMDLLNALEATGKPYVVVVMAGSALSINKIQADADAIIYAGYPGEQGGNAIADVLFGNYNPAGRLPVTYYKSVDQLPSFEDYSMKGRTYRYFSGEPLYPFGYGLSYTNFTYSDLEIPATVIAGEEIIAKVKVTNSGKYDGDEVIQLYLTDLKGSTPRAIRDLKGVQRVHIKKGESKVVEFKLDPRKLSMINRKGERVIEPGMFDISIGGEQPGFKGYLNAPTTMTLTKRFKVKGKASFEL